MALKNKNKDKENKLIKAREKFSTKFINTIKKRWLISSTNTILLIAILVLIVIIINMGVKKLDLTPIDCTKNKEYTLTDESKSRVKNIEEQVKVYCVGYTEEDGVVTLAKQYNKANENISIEVIDANERTDIAQKYYVSNDDGSIIVENGDKSKIVYEDDMYTYDENYNTIDRTEEALTSAILKVTNKNIPNIYFLTEYSDYKLSEDGGMQYFSVYLKNEILNYKEFSILTESKIPDDCNTLVITTPSKDFDELTTNEIINYINKGGNILWLNSSFAKKVDLPNVNKILALYAINPFDEGYVYETEHNRTLLNYDMLILEDLQENKFTKNLKNVAMLTATKINVNQEKLEEQNVTMEPIITTNDTTYFRKDVTKKESDKSQDEKGSFTLGGIFTKTISKDEENSVKSELIIYGDNNFITDLRVNSQVYPIIGFYDNKDVVLNSIAYLTDTDEDITIRKDYTQTSSFTATDSQKSTIMKIVFIVPIVIIVLGIVISFKRKFRN